MPQRFLRPGITNSERWNGVSFAAQSLYIRLITLVDDYGRYDGRSSVIWAQCFAVWNEQNQQDSITPQQVEQMLQELAGKELVEIYTVQNKKVVQISQWQERIRDGVAEKWPSKPKSLENPQVAEKLQQLPATACKNLPSSSSSSSSSGGHAASAPCKKLSAADTVKFDSELKRATAELASLGRVGDYPVGSRQRNRIAELQKRVIELREILGVRA